MEAVVFAVAWFATYTFESRNAWSMPSGEPIGRRVSESMRFVNRMRETIGSLPPAFFGIAWTALYALNTAASAVHWRRLENEYTNANTVDEADHYRKEQYVFIGFLLANIFLNKLWTPIFFAYRRPGIALVDLLLVIATAIVVYVMLGLSKSWVAFGLWSPYVLFLFVALALNIRFLNTSPIERA